MTDKTLNWYDESVEPNGIGPVCRFCNLLIDTHPDDHTLSCPVNTGKIKEWPWDCPRCEFPSLATINDHICNQCWYYRVFCKKCSEELYSDDLE